MAAPTGCDRRPPIWRYALLALVCIAGEECLYGPDLNAPEPADAGAKATAEQGYPTERRPKSCVAARVPADRGAKEHVIADAGLKSQLSAVLREQLLCELKEVSSVDAAAIWARRVLSAKNSLNLADARQLENAFQARLAELELGADNAEPRPSSFGSYASSQRPLSGKDRSRPDLPLSRGSKKRSCPS